MLLDCQVNYVGKTGRNFEVRQSEHADLIIPARNTFPKQKSWVWMETLDFAIHWKSRKFKETIYIANLKPSLNKQIKSFELWLFPS